MRPIHLSCFPHTLSFLSLRIRKGDNSKGTAYLTDVGVARFALRVLSGCALSPAGHFRGVEGMTRQLVA